MERHQRLDERLRHMQVSRFADSFEMLRLKKMKLSIKDRLARLARSPLAVG
jgi:hypothetical protein